MAINVPNITGARRIVKNPIPVDRIAFISLSSDSFPNVAKVASNTAIGTESATIQAKLRNRYSNIVMISNPFPRNLSIALNRKLMNNKKVIINKEIKNGRVISRIKYLSIISILKITILDLTIFI
tara:strand:+ start:349 stop:723 length:375 start_codon:yes stop_codon:yes gene_type:complete